MIEVDMEREQIGKGYYAVDADAVSPSSSTSAEVITQAFHEAFSIPSNEIRVVSAAAAQIRQYGFQNPADEQTSSV